MSIITALWRGKPIDSGESEMVFASRERDQRIADGLRGEMAQMLFGLILQSQNVKAQVPAAPQQEIDGFIRRLQRS